MTGEELPPPLAYFITIACYGSRLHGDESGSVDRSHNVYGTPFLPPNLSRYNRELTEMDQLPYEMDQLRREKVLCAIEEVCAFRDWMLIVLHARINHVHTIVHASRDPERVMLDLKAYASRKLNEAACDEPGRKRWERHGSTRYLWKVSDLEKALHYVLHEQGEPMTVFLAEDFPEIVGRISAGEKQWKPLRQSRDRQGAG